MRFLLCAIVVLSATEAFAQQTSSPTEQALGQKLMAEIASGIQCSTGNITLRAELDKAQARIKELEAKEPKK